MKKDLIELYAKKENINFVQAKKEVEYLLQTIKECVVNEKIVKFEGVGTFQIFNKKARYISNPVTREKMLIQPTPTVKFTFSKKLKEKL
jgi:nucleoid DNA-binding protein